MKIKKQDKVKITAGKDKGREGVVENVFGKKGKVLVQGVNLYKKHVKPRGSGRPGGIVEMARPLPMGNIALICPVCAKITRVGFKRQNDKKIRICRKCGKEIDR